jgi:hypothetical protein
LRFAAGGHHGAHGEGSQRNGSDLGGDGHGENPSEPF